MTADSKGGDSKAQSAMQDCCGLARNCWLLSASPGQTKWGLPLGTTHRKGTLEGMTSARKM